MKVVRKLLAPLLVVGILLTSLISLHQLKADKKKRCISYRYFTIYYPPVLRRY